MNENQPPADLLSYFAGSPPFLQQTIDTLPVPIFYKDTQGVYLGCNQAFEHFVQISHEELIGSTAHDLFETEFASACKKADTELCADGGTQCYENEFTNQVGETLWVVFHKKCFYNPQGEIAGIIGVIFDITAQKKLEEKLTRYATLDQLTGLFNRREGQKLAATAIELAVNKEINFGVMLVDVDRFKQVNDRYGHAAGDQALQHIAAVISKVKQSDEVVIRWGGEEFLILTPMPLECVNVKEKLIKRANEYRQGVSSSPLRLKSRSVAMTISIGVSCYTNQTLEELINQADSSMYRAKKAGRNRVCD
ncbi:hypothetical protein BCU68_03400 [Vibrio sp. 10N.286.49.B3]|nr:hypothetical protein BCU68_03400 [Vibrio sp. 10N.286.49.B3]